jgi:hypothetical protein
MQHLAAERQPADSTTAPSPPPTPSPFLAPRQEHGATRLSLVGYSLGGLINRYAVGR